MKKEDSGLILSISLLCSGRNKDEMIKCLDSLMTIRRRMSSEIVIVDTGCGPDTKPLLSKYADKIVEFKWCNDFAKARNAGLKECSGEWFMFIDDDEWFENTDALVDFFNSGEYKKYGSAQYIIRNYTDFDGKGYEDAWSQRLMKHVDGLSFHGKIHEYLVPVTGDEAKIKSMIHHYGYVYKDKTGVYKKAQRNIPPLLEMIKEEPYNAQWRAQLIQEYRNIRDFSSMEHLSSESLETIKDIDRKTTNLFRGMFYEGVLIAQINTYRYREAAENIRKFLSDKRNTEKCNVGLCYYAVNAYWGLKSYQNVFIYAQRYLESYSEFSKKEDTTIDDLTFMCGNIFGRYKVLYCISRAVAAGVRCGNISVIKDYFNSFDLEYKDEPIIPFCQGISYAFANYDFDQTFVTIASEMCKHTYLRTLLMDEARKAEKEKPSQFDKLVDVYGMVENNDDIYLLYLRLIYAFRHDRAGMSELYGLIFNYVVDFFDMDSKIWQMAEEAQVDLKSLFKATPFIKWKRSIDLLFDKHFDEKTDVVNEIAELIKGDGDLRFEYFRLKASEHYIEKMNDKSLQATMLNKYCTDCVNFYLKIYRPELFTGDTTVLPQECQFAMKFITAVTSEAKLKPIDYIKMLEACAALYEPFTDAVKTLILDYGRKKTEEFEKINISDGE